MPHISNLHEFHRAEASLAAAGADDSAEILEGASGTTGELFAIGLGWGAPVLLLLSTGFPEWAFLVALAMAAHLGIRAMEQFGRESRRLIVTDRGVAVTGAGRAAELRHWHLYDTVRLELLSEAVSHAYAHTQPRWRLTLVNAYKPSISTYLHRRGTDAPIFTEAIVFTFRADETRAEALQRRIEHAIREATANFRILRLKEMHEVAPDPARVLRLHRCPACDDELGPNTPPGRCPACGLACDPSTFRLDGHAVGPAVRYALAIVVCCVAGFGAAGGGFGGLAAVAFLVALAIALVWICAGRTRHDEDRTVVLVTPDGVEWWRDGARLAAHDWSTMFAARSVQIEFGRWRLALWGEPKHTIHFSRLCFMWFTTPRGAPLLDLVLDADEQTGRLLCDEVQRRMTQNASDAPALPVTAPPIRPSQVG